MNQQTEYPVVTDEAVLSEDAVVLMPETVITEKVTKRKKKPRRFWPFLLTYSIVLLVLITGALAALNIFLTNYEAATPNAALNQYVEWLQAKNYTAIYEAAELKETAFNDKNAYLQYFSRIYGGEPNEIKLRERPTKSEEPQQFSVYFDDKRVDILNLLPPDDKNNNWRLVPQIVYQEDYVIYASPDVRVTVNGEEISMFGISPTDGRESVFHGLDDISLYPDINCYTLSGLLNPPEIKALSLSGEDCTILNKEKEPYIFRVMNACSEETNLEQEEFAKNAAFTYAKYTARDAQRATLLKLVYSKSDLYAAIKNFSNQYFPKHQSYEFKDVELTNLMRYTDSDFSCEVKFQPYYTRNGKVHKGEYVHYRMSFFVIEDEWKMATLSFVADNSSTSSSTTESSTTTPVTTTTTH